jgi:hypothetical protein
MPSARHFILLDLAVLASNWPQQSLRLLSPPSLLQDTNTHLLLRIWRALLPQLAIHRTAPYRQTANCSDSFTDSSSQLSLSDWQNVLTHLLIISISLKIILWSLISKLNLRTETRGDTRGETRSGTRGQLSWTLQTLTLNLPNLFLNFSTPCM